MNMLHADLLGVVRFPLFVMAWVAKVTERHAIQGKLRRGGDVILASFLVAQIACSKVCACASLDIARIGLFLFLFRRVSRGEGFPTRRADLLVLRGVAEINGRWFRFGRFARRIMNDLSTSFHIRFLRLIGHFRQGQNDLISQQVNDAARPYLGHFCVNYLIIHGLFFLFANKYNTSHKEVGL